MRLLGFVTRTGLLASALGGSDLAAQEVKLPRRSTDCRVTVQAGRIDFVFPPPDRTSWQANPPRHAFQTTAVYWWEAAWPADEASEIEQRSLWLLYYADSTAPGIISFPELVSRSKLATISDRASIVDHIGIVAVPDSAASSAIRENRLVLSVTVQAARDRYLKHRPDTATFTFAHFGDSLEICRAPMPVL